MVSVSNTGSDSDRIRSQILDEIPWTSLDKSRFFALGAVLVVAARFITFPAAVVKTRTYVQKKVSANC